MQIDLFALMKFGRKDHMVQLREKGVLYMKHNSEFAKMEDGGLRGDKFEDLSSKHKIFNIELSIGG